jgi:hypothetical protein
MMEWWINGLVLIGTKLNFILRNRTIPIFDPIFQYSSIPTFQSLLIHSLGVSNETAIFSLCCGPHRIGVSER